jgi:hypothetical protein
MLASRDLYMKHFGLHFILVGLLLSGCTGMTSPTYSLATSTPSASHLEFAVGDCQTLEPEIMERLEARFNDLMKATETPNTLPFDLWHVWKCEEASNRTRYILFEAQPTLVIPPEPSGNVRIVLLDDKLQVIYTGAFATGYGMDLESASLKFDSSLDIPVIEVRSSSYMEKNVFQTQIYGIANDTVWLIRSTRSDKPQGTQFSPQPSPF